MRPIEENNISLHVPTSNTTCQNSRYVCLKVCLQFREGIKIYVAQGGLFSKPFAVQKLACLFELKRVTQPFLSGTLLIYVQDKFSIKFAKKGKNPEISADFIKMCVKITNKWKQFRPLKYIKDCQ